MIYGDCWNFLKRKIEDKKVKKKNIKIKLTYNKNRIQKHLKMREFNVHPPPPKKNNIETSYIILQ